MLISDLFFTTPSLVLLTVLLALALDALLGDPDWLYRHIPHPVVLIGNLISLGEKRLNSENAGRLTRIVLGGLWSLLVIALAAGIGYGLTAVLHLASGEAQWLALIPEALIASSLLAYRGLGKAVLFVATELGKGLPEGRIAISHLVGRDPESLDEAGVSRAAIESMAENYSDGVVAPLFWFVLLGLPGLCAYKAINTLDSMIGHRNDRYEAFGKVAARIDDLANLVPARIAGLFYVLGALLVPSASAGKALGTMLRDAGKHRSPNAGWQEAAVAGALDFALAGPRKYPGYTVDDPYMGNGTPLLNARDIKRALQLYLGAGFWMSFTLLSLWASL